MRSLLGNGTKTKLLQVQQDNETARSEIKQQEEELAQLKREIQACVEAQHGIDGSIERERQAKSSVDADGAGLANELAAVRKEVVEMQKRVLQAKTQERLGLHGELALFEAKIKDEREIAQKSTDVAQRETATLRQEQEKERVQWQTIKQEHEEAQQRAKLSSQQVSRVQAGLETLKKDHAATREALEVLKKSHERLSEEHGMSEKSLQEQTQECNELEAGLSELDKQARNATSAQQEIESSFRARHDALASVTAEVDRKNAWLQQELATFEQQFQEAKEQRERLLSDTSQVRDALGTFLPAYFRLQTEHAQNQRELQKTRRDHETLQWEHHKVERDLQMLAKSYDASYLSSLAAKTPP